MVESIFSLAQVPYGYCVVIVLWTLPHSSLPAWCSYMHTVVCWRDPTAMKRVYRVLRWEAYWIHITSRHKNHSGSFIWKSKHLPSHDYVNGITILYSAILSCPDNASAFIRTVPFSFLRATSIDYTLTFILAAVLAFKYIVYDSDEDLERQLNSHSSSSETLKAPNDDDYMNVSSDNESSDDNMAQAICPQPPTGKCKFYVQPTQQPVVDNHCIPQHSYIFFINSCLQQEFLNTISLYWGIGLIYCHHTQLLGLNNQYVI